MFNFNHDQDDANPHPNNFCGGYSLAAIVSKLQPFEDNDPIHVYTALLPFQNLNLNRLFRNTPNDPSPNAQTLINGAQLQGSGTNILLPSTFLAAQYAQLNYEAYLNRTTYVREATPDLPGNINADDIVDEEIATINAQGGHLNLLTVQPDEIGPSLEEFLQEDFNNNQHRYWLVLVLKGRHWVAIKRGQNGGYCIYNPGRGINAEANIAGDVIEYTDSQNIAHTDNWSGIAISVA